WLRPEIKDRRFETFNSIPKGMLTKGIDMIRSEKFDLTRCCMAGGAVQAIPGYLRPYLWRSCKKKRRKDGDGFLSFLRLLSQPLLASNFIEMPLDRGYSSRGLKRAPSLD